MSGTTKHTPKQLRTLVTLNLCVNGAADAIEFYKRAFGAVEVMRIMDGGKVGHAELRIGDALIYLADEYPELGFLSPPTIGGSSVLIHLTVPDVDALVDRAAAAGAAVVRPVADQLHGDRSGTLVDPFGYRWTIATPIEDASAEEVERRYAEANGQE